MRYFKGFIAYVCLIIIWIIVFYYIKYYNDFSYGDRLHIHLLIFIPLGYIYHKYKPFKLTGDLDLRIKKIFDSYFESQKTCPNCDRVVKASELTSDGKCVYCEKDKK